MVGNHDVKNATSVSSTEIPIFCTGDTIAFPMKEDFAKLCFETLLQFSFFKESDNEGMCIYCLCVPLSMYMWSYRIDA